MNVRWKDFELPTRIIEASESSQTYGKFIAEPFENGFATTIGNALRRVLYSSIEGAAVTGVKIKGAAHEFTSLEGIVEDATDIVLNIKQLVIRMDVEGRKTLTLSVSKKGIVTAAQIKVEAGVEVVNPDLHLLTLAEDVEFEAEIFVSRGRRYVTAEEQATESQDIGHVALDSSYSPIRRVRYHVENTRVGKQTSFERLVLEVWTTGSVGPEEALTEASKILRKHLNPFVQYYELGRELQINEKKEEEMRKKESQKEGLRQKLSMSISELDLSVRSANCLQSEHIETIGELVSRAEADLLKVRNFGKTSLREVKKKLSEMSLTLGMDLETIFGKKPVAFGS